MRLAVEIVIKIVSYTKDEIVKGTDSAERFWAAYFGEKGYRYRDDLPPVERLEKLVSDGFPQYLEYALRDHIGIREITSRSEAIIVPPLIFVKSISYGSLKIGTEIIFPSLAAIGLEPTDLFELLERYTPLALANALKISSETQLDVRAYGKVIAIEPSKLEIEKSPSDNNEGPNVESSYTDRENHRGSSSSKLERIWLIANFSLVIPAAVMLLAAFLIFKASGEDRLKLTGALIQERSDIAVERQKIMERYAEQMKNFHDYFVNQSDHFSALNELETNFMQEKLERQKSNK